ncbi:MAG: TonB-dependent receptor [Nevskiaceae bacterium]|nr:MAG: TonB-dependent receptor [Nevskiaceae bacterium]
MTHSGWRGLQACALATLTLPTLGLANIEDEAQRVLPTVVVTAQKTKQTQEQVPVSMTTIDGDFIKEIGALDVDTIQNYSANTTILMTSSAAQVSVRGLGTPNSNQASDPSVGTVVDGVFYGRSSFATAFIDDLDRFEVLRGPQGTLFGKNSTAGLLNVTTRAPEEDASARMVVLTAGYGERTYRPMLNLPMMPGVKVRVSGNYSMSDGILYNTYLRRDERNPHLYTSRLRISVEPVAGWRGDLEGFVSNQYQNFNIFKITSASPAMQQLIQSYDANFDSNPKSNRNSSNVPSTESAQISGANLTLTHDMGGTFGIRNLDLTSITAYGEQYTKARDLDADFTPVPFIRDTLTEPSPYRQFSQELRFSGDHPDLFGWGHGFSFVSGLYFFNSNFRTSDNFQIERLDAAGKYFYAANTPSGTPSVANGVTYRLLTPVGDLISILNGLNVPGINLDQAARVNLNQRDKAYAVYGQFEQFFLPEWSLIGGLRFGFEKKQGLASSQSNSLPAVNAVAGLPVVTTVISQVTGKPSSCGVSLISLIADQCNHVTAISNSERDFSPKLGVKWSPDKRTSAYATFSRGFKSGGFNALPLSPDNLQFGPERATSYELGAKTRLFGGSMNVSASVFNTDFDNLQISSFQNNSFVILNAAAARSRGFELDSHWLPPVTGLSLYSSVGFAEARYKSYYNAPAKSGSKSGDPGVHNCTDSSGSGAPTSSSTLCQDLSGKPLAFAPLWTASLVPSYSRNVESLGLIATFSMDLLYRDSRYLDVDDDDKKLQPSNTVINARAIVGRPDENWSVTVAAQNLTNQLIFDQVVGQPLAPGNFASVRTDRGRFYTASLTLNF